MQLRERWWVILNSDFQNMSGFPIKTFGLGPPRGNDELLVRRGGT